MADRGYVQKKPRRLPQWYKDIHSISINCYHSVLQTLVLIYYQLALTTDGASLNSQKIKQICIHLRSLHLQNHAILYTLLRAMTALLPSWLVVMRKQYNLSYYSYPKINSQILLREKDAVLSALRFFTCDQFHSPQTKEVLPLFVCLHLRKGALSSHDPFRFMIPFVL